MASLWFWIVAVMVAAYVVLDGFDLGAGAIYLLAAKTNDERRRVLRAIGPVWDGNEVWLLAAGGTLYFAFPRLYASSFSGFYLPLMIVLWLLMLRAIGIEFRAHIETRSGRSSSTWSLAVSSILLAVFFGAALGNVVRGVPLDATGYFFEPLWTNFKLGPQTGILDWYTVLTGVVALVTLAAHGSYYVALKTDEDLGRRARGFALLCWPLQFFLTFIRWLRRISSGPKSWRTTQKHPIGILVPIVVVASLGVDALGQSQGQRETGVRCLQPVHHRHAGGRGVCALSRRAACPRSPIRPHHLQHRRRHSRTERRLGLVDARRGAGGGLLCVRLSHVPRQGAGGRRALLEIAAD